MTDRRSTMSGRIITFYSFKGGTGRSMAVANIGYLLALREPRDTRRVLLIDWDLEAPGLHRYFWSDFYGQLNQKHRENQSHPTPMDLNAKEYSTALNLHSGLMELLANYKKVIQESSSQSEIDHLRDDFLSKFDDEYVLRCDDSKLALLKAGAFDVEYPSRIQNFDWRDFHKTDPGFFRAFRDFLAEKYSFVLIDSRTGLTDTSGICTQEMPDTLVLVFVPNRQNIEGLCDVVRRVKLYRTSAPNQTRLSIYPLASRIDASISTLRMLWRHGGPDNGQTIEGYQPVFERLLKDAYELEECRLEEYFDATQVPHDVSFAFGEKIAARISTTEKLSMGAAYANLTAWLVSEFAAWEKASQSQEHPVDSERTPDRLSNWLKVAAIIAAVAVVVGIAMALLSMKNISDSGFNEVQLLQSGKGPVVSAVFDGSGTCFTLSENLVQMWECREGKVKNSWSFNGVTSIAINSKNSQVLLGVSTGDLIRLMPWTGEINRIGSVKVPIKDLFWPSEDTVVVIPAHGSALLIRLTTNLKLDPIEVPPKISEIKAATVDRKGAKLACAGPDGKITISGISEPSSQEIKTKSSVTALSFSPENNRLATAQDGGKIVIYDISTGLEANRLVVPTPPGTGMPVITSLEYSPDGKFLVATNLGSTIQVWDTGTNQLRTSLQNNAAAYTARFDADGTFLITSSASGVAHLWAVDSAH